jgi:hypothetical protein
MALGALLLTAGVIGAFVIAAPAGAVIDTHSVSVDDAEGEYDSVNGVELEMNGEVGWSDAPEPVEELVTTVEVEGPNGNYHQTHQFTCYATDPVDVCGFETNESGSTYHDLFIVQVIEDTPWSGPDFTPADGETKETRFDLRVTTEIRWDGGSETASSSDEVVITVTNPVDAETQIYVGLTGNAWVYGN